MKFAKATNQKVSTPYYATPGSAGADLCVSKTVEIMPQSAEKVEFGLSFEIPAGFFGMVVPRSSLFNKTGLILTNSVGIIDSDYRGNITANLYNTGIEKVVLCEGFRIAQIIIIPYLQESFIQSTKLSETIRGSGGYGSTDNKIQEQVEKELHEITYIKSAEELPLNTYSFIKEICDDIFSFHSAMLKTCSDTESFINHAFNTFYQKIDKAIDDYVLTLGYALEEKKNDKN